MNATSLCRLMRLALKTLLVPAMLCVVSARSDAQVDSFFDIFVEAWNSGEVRLEPIDTQGLYPFPPPPLNFPASTTVPIEMVALSLTSIEPLQLTDLGNGSFNVDSFFDIEYRINFEGGPSDFVVDSFFDITYQITPDGRGTDDFQMFDIELVELNLVSPQPIDIDGIPGPDFDLGFHLEPVNPAGLDGHVTVLKLANGSFQVDSFFDIFVELRVDGAPVVATNNSEIRVASTNNVPEPSTWAMLGVAGLAFMAIRRRLN